VILGYAKNEKIYSFYYQYIYIIQKICNIPINSTFSSNKNYFKNKQIIRILEIFKKRLDTFRITRELS